MDRKGFFVELKNIRRWTKTKKVINNVKYYLQRPKLLTNDKIPNKKSKTMDGGNFSFVHCANTEYALAYNFCKEGSKQPL